MALFSGNHAVTRHVDRLALKICANGVAREAQLAAPPPSASAEPFGADLIVSDGQGFELWLGSLEDALCQQTLQQKGITGFLNCATAECVGDCAVYRERGFRRGRTHARGLSLLAESEDTESSGPRPIDRDQVRSVVEFDSEWYSEMLGTETAYHSFSAEDKDGYEIDSHFEETFAFLRRCQEERRKVLVHCVMGINRSAAVLVAYLCQELGFSLEQAVGLASERHGHILSNGSFLRLLTERFGQQRAEDRAEGGGLLLRMHRSCPDMRALDATGAVRLSRSLTDICVCVC